MGVGFPQSYKLLDFGQFIYETLGEVPYHVGSSLTQKNGEV
jgi:hypothetical protein